MIAADRPVFFDASVLLEVLLAQPRAQDAARRWDAASHRAGSVLLEAECRTVLRRVTRAEATRRPTKAQRAREVALATWLDTVSLRTVDRAVLDALAAEPRLGACRTLDALHLATALDLRARWGREMALCTLDMEMAGVARDLGFEVLA